MDPKFQLSQLALQLLNDCNWNSTSQSHHVAKVIVAASRRSLLSGISADLAKKEPQYMRGFTAVYDKLTKSSEEEIYEALIHCVWNQQITDRDFYLANAEYLIANCRLDLLPHFETRFRGEIKALHALPLNKAYTIVETEYDKDGKTEHHFYVTYPDDKNELLPWKSPTYMDSSYYTEFKHAVAFCLSPEFVQAIIKLSA